jgi:hypothetical protein
MPAKTSLILSTRRRRAAFYWAASLAMLGCSAETPANPAIAGPSDGSAGAAVTTGAGGAPGDAAPDQGEGGSSEASAVVDAISEEATNCEPIVALPPGSATLDLIDGTRPDNSWWIVTSSSVRDSSTLVFSPPASPPAPTPTLADDRTFLHLTGSGLISTDYGVLGFSPRPSVAGGDPSDFSGATGITFDAKGSNVWVVINTADVDPRFCKCSGTDCFIGYRYNLPVTTSWATYTVTWDQFQLPSYVVNRPAFDPTTVVTVSFGGVGSDFEVSIDNLRLSSGAPDASSEGD